MVLIMGALLGVPVALVAYFFLKWVADVQTYVFTTLPADLGFTGEPSWWPIPLLVLSGVLVALTIKHLPGTAGHEPAEGFKAAGQVRPIDLPGIIIAAFATLSLGVVLGPEAPLIAIGSGLGVLAVRLLKKDAPEQAVMVIAAAASFAAISTLLGSPLVGAFLLMEAAGLGGGMLSVVLIPGLLAAGVGSLIFIGLERVTGFGTFALAIPDIPTFTTPTVAEFVWAIGIGLAAAVVGAGIRRLALTLQPIVARRRVALTPVAGLAIGLAAFVFAEGADRSPSEVLFSGQSALPSLVQNAAGWTVGALLLLIVCKGLAYGVALSAFRGGPTFPGMFIGAAGWHRAFAPARAADDRRRGDGYRGDDDRHVGAPAHLGPADGGLPVRRCGPADTAGDRRRRGGLRRQRAPHAGATPASSTEPSHPPAGSA